MRLVAKLANPRLSALSHRLSSRWASEGDDGPQQCEAEHRKSVHQRHDEQCVGGGGVDDGGAFEAKRFTAVMDCPTGPRTIHRVGTMSAAPTLCCASRFQISDVIRLRPKKP